MSDTKITHGIKKCAKGYYVFDTRYTVDKISYSKTLKDAMRRYNSYLCVLGLGWSSYKREEHVKVIASKLK